MNIFEQIISKHIDVFQETLKTAISNDIRAFLGGGSVATPAAKAPKAQKTRKTPKKTTNVGSDVIQNALSALALVPEGVSAKDLGEALSLDKAATSKVLKTIVKSGQGYKTGGTRNARYFTSAQAAE